MESSTPSWEPELYTVTLILVIASITQIEAMAILVLLIRSGRVE